MAVLACADKTDVCQSLNVPVPPTLWLPLPALRVTFWTIWKWRTQPDWRWYREEHRQSTDFEIMTYEEWLNYLGLLNREAHKEDMMAVFSWGHCSSYLLSVGTISNGLNSQGWTAAAITLQLWGSAVGCAAYKVRGCPWLEAFMEKRKNCDSLGRSDPISERGDGLGSFWRPPSALPSPAFTTVLCNTSLWKLPQ